MIFTELVTGATTPVEVYGGLAACADYLLSSSSDGAVAFRGLEADDQKRRLIDATRYIDALSWMGAPTGLAGGTPTTLAFPRTGLVDAQGAPLDATNVPTLVVAAAFKMAGLIAADPSVTGNVDTGSNVESLGAGPARIAFFRPSSVLDGNATVLPTVINRLVGQWLAGAGSAVPGGVVTGGSARNHFGVAGGCRGCGFAVCRCSDGRRDVDWPV